MTAPPRSGPHRGLSAVDFLPVPDPHHENKQGTVLDLVNDPVVPHADTVKILLGKLFATMRAWIRSQR